MDGDRQLDSLQYETARMGSEVSEMLSEAHRRDHELESLSSLLEDIKRMQGDTPQVPSSSSLVLLQLQLVVFDKGTPRQLWCLQPAPTKLTAVRAPGHPPPPSTQTDPAAFDNPACRPARTAAMQPTKTALGIRRLCPRSHEQTQQSAPPARQKPQPPPATRTLPHLPTAPAHERRQARTAGWGDAAPTAAEPAVARIRHEGFRSAQGPMAASLPPFQCPNRRRSAAASSTLSAPPLPCPAFPPPPF